MSTRRARQRTPVSPSFPTLLVRHTVMQIHRATVSPLVPFEGYIRPRTKIAAYNALVVGLVRGPEICNSYSTTVPLAFNYGEWKHGAIH